MMQGKRGEDEAEIKWKGKDEWEKGNYGGQTDWYHVIIIMWVGHHWVNFV